MASTLANGDVGPRQLEPVAAADDPQSMVADPAGLVEVDAERDELLHRTRGESVTADLLARERRLLQEHDVDAGLGEVGGGGGAARPGSDDDDVSLALRCCRQCRARHR